MRTCTSVELELKDISPNGLVFLWTGIVSSWLQAYHENDMIQLLICVNLPGFFFIKKKRTLFKSASWELETFLFLASMDTWMNLICSGVKTDRRTSKMTRSCGTHRISNVKVPIYLNKKSSHEVLGPSSNPPGLHWEFFKRRKFKCQQPG